MSKQGIDRIWIDIPRIFFVKIAQGFDEEACSLLFPSEFISLEFLSSIVRINKRFGQEIQRTQNQEERPEGHQIINIIKAKVAVKLHVIGEKLEKIEITVNNSQLKKKQYMSMHVIPMT